MSIRLKLLSFFYLSLFSFFSLANNSGINHLFNHQQLEKLKQTALADDYAYYVAEALTTEFGARQAGSQAELKSIDWLESKMQEIGLKNIHRQAVPVRNWRRHSASITVNTPYQHKLVTVSLGGSVPTPAAGINAELVRFNSIEELRSAKAENVKGKIVYIAKALKTDSQPGDYIENAQARQQGAVVAAQLGAQAIVIRSLTTLNSRIAHTGSVLYQHDVRKIPAAAVSPVDAELLDRLFTKNLPVNISLKLDNTETQWQDSYNLVGDIIGTESPNEFVLLIAHTDSWDLGTGALDNAAGVGIMLSTMHQLAQLPSRPKRSIRVLFVTNSQFNQSGIQTYIKHNQAQLTNIIVASESDLGAGFIETLDTSVSQNQLSKVDYIHTLVSDLEINRGHNNSSASTNSKHLLKYKVPIFNWVQNSQDYFKYLHSANDTFDKIELEALQQNVAVYSLFTYIVANSDMHFDMSQQP
ncbi:M28 family peptidase [Catenovulum sp. 2E275]|uniref:M28 family peptidase n=1 Tax=Catenovulum sp. 2E275 TaxID=2980497 RepID=UPI0021CDFA5B|nr:M28 family peptidase [Catenovulum sp. 2E275]MCU4676291.1 M28 family peptidase [Catenovulum sp. 2E275]